MGYPVLLPGDVVVDVCRAEHVGVAVTVHVRGVDRIGSSEGHSMGYQHLSSGQSVLIPVPVTRPSRGGARISEWSAC